MHSADFSRQALLRASDLTPQHVRETPQLRDLLRSFRLMSAWFNSEHSEQLSDFDLLGNLIHAQKPYIKFLSVRPDVCLRLPSDSVSRRTPLSSAVHFPLLGRVGDLHPLERTHAGRTNKDNGCNLREDCSHYYLVVTTCSSLDAYYVSIQW